MASRRESTRTLADAIVTAAGGDVEVALRSAEEGDRVWWGMSACGTEIEFPVDELRAGVLAVLRDRRDHPDPFDSFPEWP